MIAIIGGIGQREVGDGFDDIGLCLLQSSLGLGEFSIGVGGFDFGEKLALFDVIVDIDHPSLHVPIDAGVYRGLLHGAHDPFDVGGQLEV